MGMKQLGRRNSAGGRLVEEVVGDDGVSPSIGVAGHHFEKEAVGMGGDDFGTLDARGDVRPVVAQGGARQRWRLEGEGDVEEMPGGGVGGGRGRLGVVGDGPPVTVTAQLHPTGQRGHAAAACGSEGWVSMWPCVLIKKGDRCLFNLM